MAPAPGPAQGGGATQASPPSTAPRQRALVAATAVAAVALVACAVLAMVLVMRDRGRVPPGSVSADRAATPPSELTAAASAAPRASVDQAHAARESGPQDAEGADAGSSAGSAPPAAASAESPSVIAAAGPSPRTPVVVGSRTPSYKWRKGDMHVYKFAITTDLGDRVRTVEGETTLRVPAWDDSAPPSTPGADAADSKSGADWTGSAFVVNGDGYLATCAHVADGATRLTVHLNGGQYEGRVVSLDLDNDVALVQIDARGLTPLPLADGHTVAPGENVRVLGFPASFVLGSSLKVSQGIVSGIVEERGVRQFQIDAPINPGNSGGPVINDRGEVVGVAASVLGGGSFQGLGFAAPAEAVRALMSAAMIDAPTAAAASGAASLGGPALVSRASGSVAFIEAFGRPRRTETSRVEFVSSAVTSEKQKDESVGGFGRLHAPPAGSTGPIFGQGTVLIDEAGAISSDPAATLPMHGSSEHLTLLIEDFDPAARDSWSVEEQITLDAPTNETPGEAMRREHERRFRQLTPYGPPRLGLPFGSGQRPQGEPIAATVRRGYRIVERRAQQGLVVIEKTVSLQTGGDAPDSGLSMMGTGRLTYDERLGVVTAMSMKQTLKVNVDNVNVEAPFTITYNRMTPAEYVRDALPRAVARARKARADREPSSESAPGTEARVKSLLTSIRKKLMDDESAASEIAELAKLPVVPELRSVACKVLLAAAASDSNSMGALNALERWADATCVPALIKLLEGDDHFTNAHAAEILGKLGDARAAAPLARAMADEGMSGFQIQRAIVALGPAAEKAVLPLLKHGDDEVRRMACDILEDIGTPESIAAIEAMAEAERGSDAWVLENAAERAVDQIRRRGTLRAASSSLDELDELSTDFNTDGQPANGVVAWEQAVDVVGQNTAEERQVQIALQTLAQTAPPAEEIRQRVGAVIAARFSERESGRTQQAALAALALWGGPELAEPLLDVLSRDDDEHRPAVYAALGRAGGAKVGAALLAELDAHVQQRASATAIADALAACGQAVERELINRLASENVLLRAMAARALRDSTSLATTAAIQARIEREETTVALEELVETKARLQAAE